MSERWTYDAIRWSALNAMYRGRRNIIRDKRAWTNPLEDVGYAYYGDETPDSVNDLHDLMHETVYLILCAGLSPEPGLTWATEKITSVLARTPIDLLLRDIPEDEAREVRIDLEILGFIPPDITKPQYA